MSQVPNILALVSAVFGLILLIIASVCVDYLRPGYKLCHDVFGSFGEACKNVDLQMSAPAIGIVAGLLQILAAGLAYTKKWQFWTILHGIILVLCIVAFGIAVDQSFLASGSPDKTKAFGAFAIIDAIFALSAAIGLYRTTKTA